MAQALQMSSYKREYAKQLGVDVYSANAVLQKELGSVAWAAAAGNLTLGAATMASGSSVVAGLSYARNIDQVINIVASEPPAELMTRNRAALKKMGINKDLAERFLAQRQYSPQAKTILIMALSGMTRTAGREAVLEVSLQAPDETTAICYQQLAELLNANDARVAAIARLEPRRRLVLAPTERRQGGHSRGIGQRHLERAGRVGGGRARAILAAQARRRRRGTMDHRRRLEALQVGGCGPRHPRD